MIRANWKYLLIGATAAVALLLLAPQADAQWGCCRPAAVWGCGCGYAPCYTPCYTPCYRTCYTPCYTPCYRSYCDSGLYLGWRPGPIRRLLFGPYRWYWGGYGGCWSDCGTTCDTCGTWTPANGAAPTQALLTPTPAKKPIAEPPSALQPTEPAPVVPTPSSVLPKTSATSAESSGILTVWVPFDAKVTINGRETSSIGSRREFVSYGLQPGLVYKYVVHAQVIRDGKLLEDTQTITLKAGSIESVAFGFNVLPTEQVASR